MTDKIKKEKSPLIGAQAQPTVLNKTTRVGADLTKEIVDNVIEAGISGNLDTSEINRFTSVSNSRDQIYSLIDTMCQDSSVSSIVRTYAEDVCEPSDSGEIVWCESDDANVSKYINYLLGLMNIDKNIYGWVYSLVKYGDVYLRLYRESDYDDSLFHKNNINKTDFAHNRNTLNESKTNESINLSLHKDNDPYAYYVEAVSDPSTMFELTKFGKTYGYIETPNSQDTDDTFSNVVNGGNASLTGTTFNTNVNYRWKSSDVNIYQADDFVHACIEDEQNRFPETVKLFTSEDDYKNNSRGVSYKVKRGKSLLYDAFKVWREKQLLEGAVLLSRITRSGIVRKVGVEVGDMSKEQVQQALRRVKEMLEQKSSIAAGSQFSEYTNPGPIENFIYYATRGGQGQITIDSVGGDFDPKQLTDLDWWNNKFYASFGIPKQYFGFTEDGAGFNGGTALTVLSSVYAKGVKRVQNAIIQALTDMINLILINKGLKSYLNNFKLRMRAPLTQEEISYREDLSNRISGISNFQSLLSDVETRSPKLKILKDLMGTLHYSDDIMADLQSEIDKAKEAEDKEAADAKAEEEVNNESETSSNNSESETSNTNEPSSEGPTENNMDLAPMPDEAAEGSANESFTKEDTAKPLTENNDSPLVEANDDLPTPEEADSSKDFTEND